MKNQLNQKINALKAGWSIWLFPGLALALSGWLLINYFQQKGPVIHISFEDGSSIQPEKTRIRFRGVSVGVVKKVSISEDTKQVIAEVALQRDAENLAVDGSQFWVVMPKVGFQGISGLETLFEGTYIAVQPGNPDGEAKNEFKGKLGSDSNESLEETTPYNLETETLESVTQGDSLTFRGVVIGSVSKANLSKSSQTVLIQVNVKNRYVKLIRTNTVFWRKVGVQAKLGLFASELKISSLDSLLHGGIEVFTPDGPGPIAKALTKFNLAAGPPKSSEKWNPKLEF